MTESDSQILAFTSREVSGDLPAADDPGVGILEAFWRYRWSSLAIVAAFVALTAAAGYLLAPRARSVAEIALSTPPPGNVLAPNIQGEASLARYVEQRAAFVTSDAVLEAAARRIGQDNPAALRKRITADASAKANTVTVTVTAGSKQDAVALAEAIVWAYTEETRHDVRRLAQASAASIREDVRKLEPVVLADGSTFGGTSGVQMLNELRLRALQIERESELFGGGVEYVNAPSLDTAQEASIPIREVGVGLILGLVIAATLAWMRADHATRAARRRPGKPGAPARH